MLGMAGDDQKKKAALIISVQQNAHEEEGDKSPLKYAAEAILEAMDKRDANSLAYALERFVDMCDKSDDDDDFPNYDDDDRGGF